TAVIMVYTSRAGAVSFFSSRRRHTRCYRDWSSDVCSSDLASRARLPRLPPAPARRTRGGCAVLLLRAVPLEGGVRPPPERAASRSEERRVGKGWRCWSGTAP